MTKKPIFFSARRQARGFTLIELMIVVAIVGILARIAYPAYVDYIRRGDLAEGMSTLSSLQVKMEQYYQDNRSYVSSGTTCGVSQADTTYFTYSCTGTATTFTFTAAGLSTKPTKGDTYTIDQSGVKGTTKFKGTTVTLTNCWAKKSTTDC